MNFKNRLVIIGMATSIASLSNAPVYGDDAILGSSVPTLSVLNNVSGFEDTVQPLIYTFVVTDEGSDLSRLMIDTAYSKANILQPAIIANDNGQITMRLSPLANAYGSVTVTVTVTNEFGQQAEGNFDVIIQQVDDPPVLNSDEGSTAESTPLSIDVLANDEDTDGDGLIIVVAEGAMNGTTTVSDGQIIYRPDPGFTGDDSFIYTISDGRGEYSGNVRVTVNSRGKLNHNPMAVDDEIITIVKNGIITVDVNDLLENDSDEDGDTILITGVSNASTGSVSLTDGVITFTPPADFLGEASFNYTLSDGQGGTDTGAAALRIEAPAPQNQAPVAETDTAVVDEDAVNFLIDVLVNDTDADSDTLTITEAGILADHVWQSGKTAQDGTVEIVDGLIVYTPKADYNGPDSFSYQISDGHGETSTSTVTVTVSDVNDPPVAVDDTAITDEDTPVLIDVLDNDTDTDNEKMDFTVSISGAEDGDGVVIGTTTAGGTIQVENGKIRYTPRANYTGTDTFTYTVSDGDEEGDAGDVTVTVREVNDAPVAAGDTTTVQEDSLDVEINALGNDTDADSVALSVTDSGMMVNEEWQSGLTSQNGRVTVTGDNTILYTPRANFYGTDTFMYTVSDGSLSDMATVTVTVQNVNDAPVAVLAGATVNEDTEAEIDVVNDPAGSAADLDIDANHPTGDTLSIHGFTQPAHGTTTLRGGMIVYRPAANYNGPDSFTYILKDSAGALSAEQTVTVAVRQVNDDPVAVNDSLTINEDDETIIDVLSNDSDTDTQAGLNNDPERNPENLTLVEAGMVQPEHGTITITEDNKIRYTPKADYFGSDRFTYALMDVAGKVETAQVNLQIKTVNDAPVFSNLNDSYTLDEDGMLNISFDISDVETSTRTLMLQFDSKNQTILPNSRITLLGVGDDDPNTNIELRPNMNANGSCTLTLNLGDGFLVTKKDITINVTSVNDNPVATADSLGFTEDNALVIDMDNLVANDTDVDGDILRFDQVLTAPDPAYGTLTLENEAGHTYRFVPATNFDGTASFTYRVVDGQGGLATGTVSLIAAKVNDRPTLVMDEGNASEINEDSAIGTVETDGAPMIGFTVWDAETDPANLIVTAGSTDSGIVEPEKITLVRGSDGHYYVGLQPTPNASGLTTISITVSDGLLEATRTFDFMIHPVDDAPVAKDDIFNTAENTPLSINPLANDVDIDGDTLSIVKVAGNAISVGGDVTLSSSGATVTREAGGTLFYAPTLGFSGVDSFSYTIFDGKTESNATIKVNVTSENGPPVIYPIGDQLAREDEPVTISYLIDNPGIADTLDFAFTSTDHTLLPVDDDHIIVDQDARTITIHPVSNKFGEVSITLTVTDRYGLTDSEDFKISFLPVNDNPSIVADSATVSEDTPIVINVLANDTDQESPPTVVAVTQPAHGTLARVSDGTYRYTPSSNWNGQDIFYYTATDGEVQQTAAVTITVNPVNDAPSAYTDYVIGTWDAEQNFCAITLNPTANDADVEDGSNPRPVLTRVIISQSAKGSAAISDNNNQKIDYSYSGEEAGFWDVINYEIKDSQDAVSQGQIRIYVPAKTGSGDAQYVVTGESAWINEDRPIPLVIDLGNNVLQHIDGFSFGTDNSRFFLESVTRTANASADPLGDWSVNLETKQLSYTPNLNKTGMDEFTFTFSKPDDQLWSGSATLQIHISPVNDAPTIEITPSAHVVDEGNGNITATMVEDTSLTMEATIADVDNLRADLKFEVYSSDNTLLPDQNIEVEEGEDGRYTLNITPTKDRFGTVEIKLLASDGFLKTERTFNLLVTQENDAPYAPDRTFQTNEDIPLNMNLNYAGADPDGDTTTLDILPGIPQEPLHGSLVVESDGTVTYNPNANYFGPDTFSYQLSDGKGGTDTGKVDITVISVPDELIISDIPDQQTEEDHSLTVTFTIIDPENKVTDVVCTSGKSDIVNAGGNPPGINLTHTGENYTLVLSPVANANGDTVMTITATLQDNSKLTKTFALKVLSKNDLPLAVDDSLTTDEDTAATINVLTNDFDVEDSSLAIVAVTDPPHGKVVNNGNGTLTYTPDANYNGSDSFTYTVVDDNDGKATATVAIDVVAVNDAPAAVADTRTIQEDTADDIVLDLLANDTDIEGNSLTLVSINGKDIASLNGETIKTAKGTVTVLSDGEIDYQPDFDAAGTDSFNYVVSDGQAVHATATGTVTITITPLNDAPRFTPKPSEVWEFSEDTVGTFHFDVYDPETRTPNLIIRLTSSNQNLVQDTSITFEGSDNEKIVTFKPKSNVYGNFNLIVSVSDGSLTPEYVQPVRILPVNDAPVINNVSVTTLEDAPVDGKFTGSDTETASGGLTYALSGEAEKGPQHGQVTINPDGTWSYLPDENWFGIDTFVVVVNDNDTTAGTPGTDEAIVTVNVTPVNDAPAATADSAVTVEETAVTLNLLANDSDADLVNAPPNDDTLSFSITASPANGTVTPVSGASGTTVKYTPKKDFVGTDTFTYTLRDKAGLTSMAAVTITIGNVNDAPTAVNDTATTAEGSAGVQINVLVNDRDPDLANPGTDKDDLTVVSVGALQKNSGTVIINSGSKTINYTPAGDFNGTDSFTYTIRDKAGVTSSAQVNLTVNNVNDIPVGVPDLSETPEDNAVTISVLANDTDADMVDNNSADDSLTVESVTQPSKGIAEIVTGSKTIRYSPNANFYGTDTFTYIARDSKGGRTQATTVTLTVQPVNDRPVLDDAAVSTSEDQPVSGNLTASDNETAVNALTYTLKHDFGPAHGLVIVNANGFWTYTPDNDWHGMDSFSVIVNDNDTIQGQPLTDEGQVTVTVSPAYDAPNVMADEGITSEDTALTMNLYDNDTDIDLPATPTLADKQAHWAMDISANPEHGTLSLGSGLEEGSVTYTPDLNFAGTDSFTYTLTDTGGLTSSGTVSITVYPVNDAPSFTVGLDQTVLEDSVAQTVPDWANDIFAGPADEQENQEETLTFDVSADRPELFSVQPGITPDGTLSYTPALNAYGESTVTVRLKDNGGTASSGQDTSAAQTFKIVLTPVNDAPAFTKGSDLNVDGDGLAYHIANWATGITEGPANETAQTLTFELSNNNPTLFSVQPRISEDGTLTYTPALNARGTASITISLHDDGGTDHGAQDTAPTVSFKMIVGLPDDAAVVDDTLKNVQIGLSDGDTWESVTDMIYLIRTDLNETNVTWHSSDDTVVDVRNAQANDETGSTLSATVNRNLSDTSVIITATVNMKDLTRTRTFLLIVKSADLTKEVDENLQREVIVEGKPVNFVRINVQEQGILNSTIDKIIVGSHIAPDPGGPEETSTVALFEDPTNIASEFAIEINRGYLSAIAGSKNLEVRNDYAEVELNSEILSDMSANNLDLFFRIVPVKDETQKKTIEDQVQAEVDVPGKEDIPLGMPLKIEANYHGYNTWVMIPFGKNGIQLPTHNQEAFLDSLGVYIAHSDGSKVLKTVENEDADKRATIAYDANNQPVGIAFNIDMFSTFTVLSLETPLDNGGGPAPAIPASTQPIERRAGADRFQTAVEVSMAGWAKGADTVILARDDDFPDSLAGVPLAYQFNAPILLTPTHSLNAVTIQEIKRLHAKHVILLGGPGAISLAVESQIGHIVANVERIGGADRVETAALIAKRLVKERQTVTGNVNDTAVLAYSHSFPDALAAASYAAVRGYPILLSGNNEVSSVTIDAMRHLALNSVIISGGTSVISAGVQERVAGEVGDVCRFAGTDRYETSAVLADEFLDKDKITVYLATGRDFPDALAGAVLAAKEASGILLVDGTKDVPNEVIQKFVQDHGITNITLLGGNGAISSDLENWLKANLKPPVPLNQ